MTGGGPLGNPFSLPAGIAWLALVIPNLLLAGSAAGWADTGHKIVCEIAFRELNHRAKEEVERLIARDPKFRAFSESCTWPDHPRKRAKDHYILVPRTYTEVGVPKCPLDDRCLFTAIERDKKVLAAPHASDREKLDALKFLGHWVADIHQPLHVSYKDDWLGNRISQKDGPCRGSLHSVWDACILERILGTDSHRIANTLWREIGPKERKEWADSSPQDWANESYQLATRPDVKYCIWRQGVCWFKVSQRTFDPNAGNRTVSVTDAYLWRHSPTVIRRLKQAGVRLGNLLNELLGP